MVEIIPAIMPKNIHDIEAHVRRVEGLVGTVQIDVMDGVFVPSIDWPYLLGESEQVFNDMVEGNFLFKHIGNVQFEIDLMVANPSPHALDWALAGAHRIIFHIESIEDDGAIFDELPKDGLKEVGLALNTDTPNEAVEAFIHKIDFIQCMGIAKIGYQGQSFDERVLDKLKDFRRRFPELVLSVDGGVSIETAPRLLKAGANRLVSGSAIWESGDIIKSIKQLQQL
ncbi:MAG: hypothetical protein HZC04_01930 [Candidatus Lloydbacteria bacterium]|nr:hypothetical protein [Candidatus Lloydbacteria bacterium]